MAVVQRRSWKPGRLMAFKENAKKKKKEKKKMQYLCGQELKQKTNTDELVSFKKKKKSHVCVGKKNNMHSYLFSLYSAEFI